MSRRATRPHPYSSHITPRTRAPRPRRRWPPPRGPSHTLFQGPTHTQVPPHPGYFVARSPSDLIRLDSTRLQVHVGPWAIGLDPASYTLSHSCHPPTSLRHSRTGPGHSASHTRRALGNPHCARSCKCFLRTPHACAPPPSHPARVRPTLDVDASGGVLLDLHARPRTGGWKEGRMF